MGLTRIICPFPVVLGQRFPTSLRSPAKMMAMAFPSATAGIIMESIFPGSPPVDAV